MDRRLPKSGVIGSDRRRLEPSTFISLGEVAASLVNRLAAIRNQDNNPRPPEAA